MDPPGELVVLAEIDQVRWIGDDRLGLERPFTEGRSASVPVRRALFPLAISVSRTVPICMAPSVARAEGPIAVISMLAMTASRGRVEGFQANFSDSIDSLLPVASDALGKGELGLFGLLGERNFSSALAVGGKGVIILPLRVLTLRVVSLVGFVDRSPECCVWRIMLWLLLACLIVEEGVGNIGSNRFLKIPIQVFDNKAEDFAAKGSWWRLVIVLGIHGRGWSRRRCCEYSRLG